MGSLVRIALTDHKEEAEGLVVVHDLPRCSTLSDRPAPTEWELEGEGGGGRGEASLHIPVIKLYGRNF